MDLLATVRKEGSRGGLGDFKWSDVQNSSHREHYLGHSLMAPVGRWQKGRDLSWYAKPDEESGDGEDPAAKAARERKEEIRRVKEAEEDALARALGLPVAPRDNPNMQELGTQREVAKVLKEAAEEDDTPGSRGVGHGRLAGMSGSKADEMAQAMDMTRNYNMHSKNTQDDTVMEDMAVEADTEAGRMPGIGTAAITGSTGMMAAGTEHTEIDRAMIEINGAQDRYPWTGLEGAIGDVDLEADHLVDLGETMSTDDMTLESEMTDDEALIC